nr:hypothetical protein [uncultured Lachnoclostridium sp.]
MNEFATVEALDEVKTDDEKKYCTTKLKIGAKLSFAGFIKACVDFVIEKTAATQTIDDVAATGNYSTVDSSGKDCVICCAGADSCVKAKRGSWITLSEWKYDEEKARRVPVCVKTEFVDGERIKEDTYYILKNGEFQEVK